MRSLSQHETIPHGTPEFPAEYHYVDKKHPRYIMTCHWHKEWELVYVLEGSLDVTADDKVLHASAGDTVLFRGGMLHGAEPSDCVYQCFLFDLRELFRSCEGIKKYIRPIYRSEQLPFVLFSEQTCPEICSVASRLMRRCASASNHAAGYDELYVLGCLCEIFGQILHDGLCYHEQLPNTSHRIDSIKSALEYVEHHYADDISLESLAACAGMTPNYFCRVFKAVTHQSPMTYVLNYRVERAEFLLAGTDLPVTAVSLKCGFLDHSYFIRAFRRMKGITPKQYQLQHSEQRTAGGQF